MPTPSEERNERAADEALARSVVYRALTLGLRTPGAGVETPLRCSTARTALVAAATLLDARRRAADPLLPAAERLTTLPPPTADELASSHARLFGHARGEVCAYETEYGPEGAYHQPHGLADISGCYRAFGLEPDARIDERADHVACECEFLGFLARKEAYFLASGPEAPRLSESERAETLEAIRTAARGFLSEHLGRFGWAFATRLVARDPSGFFGILGEVLLRHLGLECERFDLPRGPATLELRPPVPDEVPMACGTAACSPEGGWGASGPIQIGRRRP